MNERVFQCGVAAFVFLACSGKVNPSESVSDASPSDATSSDAGGGAGVVGLRSAACPASEPAQGSACSPNELLCEYGNDFNPLCNSLVVCSSGRWAVPITWHGGPDKPQCNAPPPSPAPNASECPSSLDAGNLGNCASPGLTCNYGAMACSCGQFCPNYPVRRDCDAGTQNYWTCFGGGAYCTTPRPSVGSSCAIEGESCAFAAPTECGQGTLKCKSKTWSLPLVACPTSSAKYKDDIRYLDENDIERLRTATLQTRLANYRYRGSDPTSHLGFIIEDQPMNSPSVMPSREHVDLYGYMSMTVGTLQAQQKEIESLKKEVRELRRSCSRGK